MACRLRGGSCPKQPDAAAASCRVFQNSRGNTGGYPGPVCGWWLRAARFFPGGRKKDLAGLSSRIHGYSSAAGFMLLAAAPPLAGFLAYRAGFSILALFSWLCFFLAIVFFTAFITADKPSFRHTPIAWEGLWQRLTLLCMYLPVARLVFAML